jgi:HK97 family phage major capsid protein
MEKSANPTAAHSGSVYTQVADHLKKFGERLDTFTKRQEAIEKALSEPASAVGMTPEAYWNKTTDHGRTAVGLIPGSHVNKASPYSNITKGGRVKSCGWGEPLAAMAEYLKPGLAGWARDKGLHEKVWKPQSEGGLGFTQVKTALAESQGSTGGYTVPPQYVMQLMMLAIEESIMRQRCTVMPMTARSLFIPALDQTATTSGATATSNFVGGVSCTWTAESQTRNESEPLFKQVELTAWEASFYSVASNNLMADNAVALDSVLTMLFSAAIAWFTDFAFIQGDGVGKPLGFQKAPATIVQNRASPGLFSYADAVTMLSRMYWMLGAGDNLCWIMSQSVIPQLAQFALSSTSSIPVWIPFDAGSRDKIDRPAGAMSCGILLGYPVLVTEKVPKLGTKGDVSLIDPTKYLIGDRMEMAIDVSPHVYFLKNQTAWRVLSRCDGQPWLSKSVTLNNTDTVSPFVILNT